jgi:hypothetical protein
MSDREQAAARLGQTKLDSAIRYLGMAIDERPSPGSPVP